MKMKIKAVKIVLKESYIDKPISFNRVICPYCQYVYPFKSSVALHECVIESNKELIQDKSRGFIGGIILTCNKCHKDFVRHFNNHLLSSCYHIRLL